MEHDESAGAAFGNIHDCRHLAINSASVAAVEVSRADMTETVRPEVDLKSRPTVSRPHDRRDPLDRRGPPQSHLGLALRFYESQGLVRRDPQRRWAATVPNATCCAGSHSSESHNGSGSPLDEVRSALSTLPDERTPTAKDWARLSRAWRPRLDEQIAVLMSLRDQLSSCIGCGCLSLRACALYNPDDGAAALGTGPRYLLGDSADDVV